MTIIHRLTLTLILLLLPCVAAQGARFAAIGEGKGAVLAGVVAGVEKADVVFVGEIHYNPLHHAAQLEIIRSLHARKLPVAIGLEMFTPEDQQKLDEWSGGKLDEESFKPIFARNWSYGWELYREIFLFARDNRIPLVGLNVPKATIAKVTAQGPAGVGADEVPPKISWKLNPSQTEYLRAIGEQVFGGRPPEKYLARLSAAQALRNTSMAWNIARYKRQHAAARVVVLAGIWHAVKHGVPEQLAQYGDFSVRVIAPELAEFSRESATKGEADYLILKEEGR